ncbi:MULTISPECIES: DUF4376 domain-containing protein, partial [unclassified Acinetobacter]
ALDDPPFPNMFFQKGKWVSIPTQPSPYHIFNYETKKWVDNRSLEDVKKHKWEHIKQQRDQFEYGGFEFDGGIYDSDQVSQGRIMGAAVAGVDQIWTLADNTTIDLSASQLQQLYAALQAHIANAHERGRIARQKIETALTYEEIEAVNF